MYTIGSGVDTRAYSTVAFCSHWTHPWGRQADAEHTAILSLSIRVSAFVEQRF